MSSITASPSFVRPVRSVGVARPAATTSVRLTRRGRVAVALMFLVVILAAMTALGSRTAATGEAGTPISTSTVTVYPGDTLWDIAATVAEPGEVKEMIYLIQDLNGMDSSELVAGQKLFVPTR